MPTTSAPAATGIWLWIGVIGAIVVLAAIGLTIARRRLLGRDHDDAGSGFTLHDLRAMRDAGRLSEEEFQHARAMILGHAGARTAAVAPADPAAPRRLPDGTLEAAPGRDLTGAPLPEPPPGSPRRSEPPR